MKTRGFSVSMMSLLLFVTAARVAAGQESVIYSFGQFADGRDPACAPLFDAAGNMYGTAVQGGLPGEPYFNTNGIVWELSPGTGGTWTETVLYNFGTVAGDGANPSGSLVSDSAGNLYGTATAGGANGLGIVFELSPGASAGGAWTEKVLYSFQGGTADGANPQRVTLVWDGKGNLYGTTKFGGAYGSNSTGGTVFELSPASGGTWTEKLVYSFGSGTDATQPVAGVTLDAAGNMYGTSLFGGLYGDGTVFEISPASGGTWTEKVLHSFNQDGVDGKNPYDPVILDGQGNIFGTTYGGGANPNYLGTVFELTPSASGEWSENVIHTFTGDPYGTAAVPDVDFPYGGLAFDAAGNLYGAGYNGGTGGEGGVFEMTPGPGGWTIKLLYSFAAALSDGHAPAAALTFDNAGNLYGTTLSGGTNSAGQYGAVFEIAGVTVASPQFSPPPGKYSAAQIVTLSDATPNTTIYYTVNGSLTPVQYTAPFQVSASSVITAWATSATLPRSQVASAGYQIGSTVATPQFAPPAGTYSVAQLVAITDAAPGATIYYTTNGTTPTTSSTVYTGPISVTASETIEAIAEVTGLTNSAVASAKYSITPVTPPQEEVLYNFLASGTDGAVSSATLIFDAAGNLYGTTINGGANGKGSVFELVAGSGNTWTEKLLYSFGANSNDGAMPTSGLVFDGSGNLYGTSAGGGGIGQGTVFELSPATGGTWTEKVLWSFGLSITDGEVPEAGLVFDSKGNLYGTTEQGGANTTWAAGSGGWGTVFELSPGTGGTWTEKILYAFGYLSQTDGYFPTAPVIFDAQGNLYGTTSDGSSGQDLEGGGSVFKLTPAASGPWLETVLYSFGGGSPTGYTPVGGLVMDANGNLYGTANSGGNGFGLDGTLFELSPASGGGWTQTILHSFGAYEGDGINPTSTLIFDARGNLYGTTLNGGTNNAGMVYELTPQSAGGWTEQSLYNFGASGTDGFHPFAGLVFNSAGNLFGTTKYGGTHGSGSTGGTVFEIQTNANLTSSLTVTVSPTSLAFASSPEGVATAAQNVTITNTGTGTVTLNSEAISGGNSGSFLISAKTCGATLAVAASCTISVEMQPKVTGALTSSLSIADSATGSPQTVTLTGTGTTSPSLTVSLTPASLAFPSTAQGATSAAQTVTLTNTSASAVTLTSETIGGVNTGSFLISANTCTSSLAASASCVISVEFKPAKTGALTATVSVADNAAGTPQTVALSGIGLAAQTLTLSLTPATLTFASTAQGATSAAQTVTIANTGTGTVNLTSETLTGANASSYKISANTCAAMLAAGATCTVLIEFAPVATGTLTASLSVADNATGSPQSVTMTGTATAASLTVSLAPASLAFPTLADGLTSAAQTVTITNTGASNVTLASETIGGTNNGSFIISANTCTTTLAAGANCVVSIDFKPLKVGALTGLLSVADNATGSPQTVVLTGTGLASNSLTITPATLAFPNTVSGTESDAQIVTLTNTGSVSVTFTSITLGGTNPTAFAQLHTCGTTLTVGASCSIYLAFNPASAAAYSATISIADNATGSPQTVTLSGTGTAASTLTTSATALTFPTTAHGTTSVGQSVVVSNTGSSAIQINSITLAGTNPTSFIELNTCAPTLAPGATCNVAVAFTPTTTGTLTASLNIASSVAAKVVTLSGTGD